MNTKWITYDELSNEAKRSIQAYSFQLNQPLHKVIKNKLFYQVSYTSHYAKKLCMEMTPYLKSDFKKFDTYHKWFKKSVNLPNYKDSAWPCLVVEGDDGWLSDGWMRFHSYVEKELDYIPVLYMKDAKSLSFQTSHLAIA